MQNSLNKIMNENKLMDVEPLLVEVNSVIKSGLNKILYEYTVNHLMSELEKCKTEMEYYKTQLDLVQKTYQQQLLKIT